ncbi:MAG TPA: hypothetical protein VFK86_09300, partial [Bauldia sp.]|nr:hypothetical protein [Bauldia sp.]
MVVAFRLVAPVAVFLVGASASVRHDVALAEPPRIAFKPVVERALDAVILPGYRALAERAAVEATRVSDLC